MTAASILAGCGQSSLTEPAPATPPSNTNSNNLHPQEIYFTEIKDGKEVKSRAIRIGNEHRASLYGTLEEVIMNDRTTYRKNGAGLVTMFDDVQPSSAHGIVFLIKGVRFTDSVSSVRLDGQDKWAAYEWKGYV